MKKTFSLRRLGAFILAAILLSGIAVFGADVAQAQGRRRVVIVRPVRPWGWGHPWGWGYNPYGPYGPYGYNSFRYGHYVFDNGQEAVNEGYKDGYKTGRDDGKKSKSYNPERSHYFHDAGFGNFAEAYRTGFANGYRDGYNGGGYGIGR